MRQIGLQFFPEALAHVHLHVTQAIAEQLCQVVSLLFHVRYML